MQGYSEKTFNSAQINKQQLLPGLVTTEFGSYWTSNLAYAGIKKVLGLF